MPWELVPWVLFGLMFGVVILLSYLRGRAAERAEIEEARREAAQRQARAGAGRLSARERLRQHRF